MVQQEIFSIPFFQTYTTNVSNLCINCFTQGTNWIYSFVEVFYTFDFKINYLWFLNNPLDSSFNFFFEYLFYFMSISSQLQLFWAVMLDENYVINSLNFFFIGEWYKQFLTAKNESIIFIKHPEFFFLQLKLNNYIFFEFCGKLINVINMKEIQESFLRPSFVFIHFLFLTYLLLLLLIFYFSYFSTPTVEENTVDSDFLIAGLIIEGEKELGSIDDIISGIIVFVYIFGWFFYINFLNFVSILPENVLVFCFFPLMYYIIFSMPTYLIYDFGIFYNAYFRGVGPSPILLLELLYDYIACLAFYIRLFVQSVRLILMTFTYSSLHDLILLFTYEANFFIGTENFWHELKGVYLTTDVTSYFLFTMVFGKVLFWLYELFHTFFVLTAQFVAFFAMVFWLFLFLYTFFVFEKIENYFSTKRDDKRNKLNNIYFYKVTA